MVKKTTEEVTKNILDIEFENLSKEKDFDDEGYMEDQDSSREDDDDDMDDDEEVAEVVPISKEKSPLEKDVYGPGGRFERYKNKDKPNPYNKNKKAWKCQQDQVQV